MDKGFIKAISIGLSLATAVVTPAVSQGLAGPYLAASQAFDAGSFDTAASYYVKAMIADPENALLKRRALVSFLTAGDFSSAAGIATVMQSGEEQDIFVDLVLLTDLASRGKFEEARALLPETDEQLSPMLWGLLNAWSTVGAGDKEGGLEAFDDITENSTIALMGQYHKGLAYAYLGDFEAAAEIFNGDENGPLHLNRDSIVVHVEVLSELGEQGTALQVLDDSIARGFNDAQLLTLREEVAGGKVFSFTQVKSPAYGMAEAFVTMAEALSRGEPDRTALFYARLAQQLRPELADATMVVASILELEGQHRLASEAYARVPESSSLFVDAQIGRAEALREGGDTESATDVLLELADQFPEDVLVLNALGDIYRGVENFEDAAAAYSRAIDNVNVFEPRHWVLFYTRGISLERLKDWPAAEADFFRALELSPDQPFVLNYLGYSYIEMGIKFEEALDMIETAVEGMPANGYITDSLGWVLYRLGKFEEAVAPMVRAVELLPVDPIVNDHLGDVFWMVGRKLEAQFQWRRAISFDPTEVDLERIKRKLEVGLDVVLEEEKSE